MLLRSCPVSLPGLDAPFKVQEAPSEESVELAGEADW